MADLFEKIKETYGMNFELLRITANGSMQGSDGGYHTDDSIDNTFTFLLYLSDINEYNVDDVGGHTLFRDRNDKKIIAVVGAGHKKGINEDLQKISRDAKYLNRDSAV